MHESSPPRSGLADPERPIMSGEVCSQAIAGGELVVRASRDGVGLSAGSSNELVLFLPWDYASELASTMRSLGKVMRDHWTPPVERGVTADPTHAGDCTG